MSEREDRFDPESKSAGWRLRDDPRGWYGVALFSALGSLLIAIVIGLRVSLGPPILAPTESPRPQPFAAPTVNAMPSAEWRRIAIAEVKKWEGWSGKVDIASQKALTWHVTVARQTEKHSVKQEVRELKIDAKTGRVLDYRDPKDPSVAEASQAWKELLGAMTGRDEKRIRQLTTRAGFEALKEGFGNQELMHEFERMGKYWQECETHWRHLDGPDRVECSAGAEPKENGFVFKKTAEGWKFDEWYPGE